MNGGLSWASARRIADDLSDTGEEEVSLNGDGAVGFAGTALCVKAEAPDQAQESKKAALEGAKAVADGLRPMKLKEGTKEIEDGIQRMLADHDFPSELWV